MSLKRERKWLWPGVVGAIAFGLTWTAIHYVFLRELTYLGVVGGTAFVAGWFLTFPLRRRLARQRDEPDKG